MYAVVEVAGHQHLVRVGDIIRSEKIAGEPGDKVEFEKVLMVSTDDKIQLGEVLDKARVTGEIIRTEKDKKIVVIKFKRRKDYKRKQGHRQLFTEIKITDIAS